MLMWPHKAVGCFVLMGALFVSARLYGAETPDLPSQSDARPHPPRLPAGTFPGSQSAGSQDTQSFLDSQSEGDRRRLIDKQLRTFQLEVDGKYAKALKAYCDTGFGDERCLRPDMPRLPPVIAPAPTKADSMPPVPPPPNLQKSRSAAPELPDLPTVEQISGFGEDLSAIVLFGNGRRLRVVAPGPNGPRSVLPDGTSVVGIRPGEVLVSHGGNSKPVPLLFQAAPTQSTAE